MKKPTPNPPETDPVSPYEPGSKKLNDAAEAALDFHFASIADIKATPRTPNKGFSVDPESDTESLVNWSKNNRYTVSEKTSSARLRLGICSGVDATPCGFDRPQCGHCGR